MMNSNHDAEAMTAQAVAQMKPEDWHDVAFGVIGLDRDLIVRTYNRAESSLARRRPEDTIGRHFFTEVAPCTDGPGFRGHIEALAEGEEARFDFDFDFPWGARRVRIRALRQRDHLWLMVTPLRTHTRRGHEAETQSHAPT